MAKETRGQEMETMKNGLNGYGHQTANGYSYQTTDENGLTSHVRGEIAKLLPEWVFELDKDKISDIFRAMNQSHHFGKRVEAQELNEFCGYDFWKYAASIITIVDELKEGCGVAVTEEHPDKKATKWIFDQEKYKERVKATLDFVKTLQ